MPAASVRADDAKPAESSAEAIAIAADNSDLQDLVLLNAGRPVFLRLHLRLGGQGYQSTWGDYLWERFQELDADASGGIDDAEFQTADWTAFNERRTRRGDSRFEILTFLDLDTNPQDDAISFDELVEHLAQSCFGTGRNGQRQPAAGDDPLFAILDHDNDQLLDATEMTAGLDRLQRFDRDEDETYSEFELRADGNPFGNQVFAAPTPGGVPGTLLLAPVPDQPPAEICDAIVARYDSAPTGEQKDRLLTREELQLAQEEFAAADKDASGKLDQAELQAWYIAQRPDVELAADLDPEVKGRRLQIVNQLNDPNRQLRVDLDKSGAIFVRGISFELELSGAGAADPKNTEKRVRQQFKNLDQDNNDYLDKQELRRTAQRNDFAKIDKDRDGKIFVEEYVDYLRRQNEISAKRVNAGFTDRGSTLFEILDGNRNSYLSLRELRELARTASAWDRDADGKIKHDDVPRRYQIVLAPGGPSGNVNGVVTFVASGNGNQEQLSGKGPVWFQRMDRNRDGDLSRREFLGTREQFQKLDADNDGLMTPQEAEALAAKK
ncbi:MAG TPA: hypothetical protein VHD36_13885 [Pirellulales bacterium]|nr:hypothetical protein [Pirellulales bacterium]